MREKIRAILESLKRYAIWLIVAGVVVVSYFLITNHNGNGIEYGTVSVLRGSVDQVIDASGSLEATQEIDLSFRRSGEIKDVLVDIGDYVKAGDLLAEIENGQELADLQQARAVLSEAQANLNLKQADALTEDVAIAAASVDEAKAGESKVEVDLENARNNLENVKKTVAQEIESAEIVLKNAQLELEKVTVNVSADTDQNLVSVDNAAVSIKSAIGKLFSSIASGHQTVDKMYGEFGPTKYENQLVLFKKSIDEYTNLKALFMKNVESYDALKAEYDFLGAVPSPDKMIPFEEKFDLLIDNTKTLIFAAQDLMDDVIVSVDLTYTDLDTLRSEINNFATAFDTNRSAYDTARNNYDTAVISKSGDDLTLPMDVRVAEFGVEQAAVALEKVKVDGDVNIDEAEAQVKMLEAQADVQRSMTGSAKASLDKVVADPREVDLAPYRARVAQASAQVKRAESVYNDTLIKAPIDGLITVRDVDPGEFVSVGGGVLASALRMIDDSEFIVKVDVPESRITSVTNESKVTLSFDAIENEEFEGVIKTIEPAATLFDDVVYYVVKVGLASKDVRMREGMTADVYIEVAPKSDVLVIPEKAMIRDDGRYWVLVPKGSGEVNAEELEGGKGYEKIELRPGIRGRGGNVEVLSGLEEGTNILVPMI